MNPLEPAQLTVVIGSVANLALALWRAWSLQRLPEPPRAATARDRTAHASMMLSGYRQVFTFLIFGAISLLHAEAMLTTAIGFTLSVAITLLLLLRAFEHLFVPELRRQRDFVDLSLSLVGATFYGWAAAMNRGF